MCLAVPGKVLRVEGMEADVEIRSLVRRVFIALVPDVAPGEWVLVHVGTAIGRVDADEAAETLRLLEEMEAAALSVDTAERQGDGS